MKVRPPDCEREELLNTPSPVAIGRKFTVRAEEVVTVPLFVDVEYPARMVEVAMPVNVHVEPVQLSVK